MAGIVYCLSAINCIKGILKVMTCLKTFKGYLTRDLRCLLDDCVITLKSFYCDKKVMTKIIWEGQGLFRLILKSHTITEGS